MGILEAILLGLVQGLSEFLPLSSSGHLVLVQRLLGLEGDLLFFDLVLHMGTLVAVCVCMWRALWNRVRAPLSKPTLMWVFATVPTVVIFLLFESFFRQSYEGAFVGVGFLLTALMLVVADVATRRRAIFADIGFKTAFGMGVAQGFAALPGVSRSGSTMSCALVLGAERKQAAEFSFLMSVPIIVGAMLFEGAKLVTSDQLFVNVSATACVVGFLAAALSGFFAIKFMLQLLQNRRLWGFSIYLVMVAVASFLV